MRLAPALLLVLGTALDPASDVPPQQPDFSGGWTAVKDAPTGVAPAPSAVFGARFWIEQQADHVTVIRPVRDTAVRAEHVAGGPDVRSRVPGALCLGDSAVVTRVAWEAAALVHTTVATVLPGGAATLPGGLRHIFRRLDPDSMVVESTMRVAGQTEPVAVGTLYKRMTDPPPAPPAPPAVQAVPATLADVAWLSGVWTGTLGTAAIEERWTPAAGGAMLGTSRTVRNTAMTEFEFLCVAERHGGLVYSAMPNGRTPATDFVLTAFDRASATFENPAHDYPTTIRYAIQPDGALEATISGAANQRTTTFVFRKQE